MKRSWYRFVVLLFSTMILTGCEAIGDIFKAGVWVGVLLVVLVIGIIVWLFTDELGRPAVVMAAEAHDVDLSHSGRTIARKPRESKGGPKLQSHPLQSDR